MTVYPKKGGQFPDSLILVSFEMLENHQAPLGSHKEILPDDDMLYNYHYLDAQPYHPGKTLSSIQKIKTP